MYLLRLTKISFLDLISRISMCMCLGFLFSQPWIYIYIYIYKDYFKGCLIGWKRFYASILWSKTYALVHLSLEKAAAFVRHRVLWPRSFLIFIVWMNWKLCGQHPSQVGVLVTHLDPCIDWLAMYWELCIENERLLLHYKSNCVLG